MTTCKKGRMNRYVADDWQRQPPAATRTATAQRKPSPAAARLYKIICDYHREHGTGISARELNKRSGYRLGCAQLSPLATLEFSGLLVYEEYVGRTMFYYPFDRDTL